MSDPQAKEARDEALGKLKEDITKWAKKEREDLEKELAWLEGVKAKLKGMPDAKNHADVQKLKTQYTNNLQVKDFI